MAKLIINTGATANDSTADTIKLAFDKVNSNFTELYSAIGADVQIPIQTGNGGKYLTTSGTTLSWSNPNKLVNGSYNFTLGVDGTVNFDPSTNGKGVLQTTADLQFIASTNSWTFGADGRTTLPSATVPVHSYGVSGDKLGMVAFDGNYIYYCKQNYVDNSTNIWVKVAWSGTSW